MRKYNILTRPIIFILITSLLVGFFSLPIIAYPEEKDSLEYNKVLDENGNWVTQGEYYNTKWENYNCYAFAINRVEEPQFYESGNASRYSPGNICGIGDYNNAKSVSQLAEFARNDLIALGYTNVQILTTIPSVNESEELICLRRKSDGADDTGYHVMQYDYSSNAWYHKPGNSAVLKYTANGGVPSNNDASWYTEMSHTGTMYSDDTCYYNSDIVFIKYSKLQLEAQWCNEVTENINVKAGKDTIYEITVDKSDSYDITLTSQCEELTYNYEIYAYNKFTGYYEVLTSGNGTSGESITESLYFNLINDYYDDVPGWELQAIKYYVRLDFDGENELNSLINVSIEHSHTYNDNYISYSTTQHKAYCECGEYVLKNMIFLMVIAQCVAQRIRLTITVITLSTRQPQRIKAIAFAEDM